jgi:hypothetical protein
MRVGEVPPGCEFKINAFSEIAYGHGGIATAVNAVLPFLAALLLGVAVVGREIERGTTRLAWALAPSRMRWLLHRAGPALLIVVVMAIAFGAVADRLMAAVDPGIDPGRSLERFGERGVVLVARTAFVFTVAAAIGAVVGRALPALILAGLVAAVGLFGGSQVHDRMIATEAVVIEEFTRGDRWTDQRFRLPDGRLIGWQELEQIDPPPTDPEFEGQWPSYPEVMLGIRGERYPELALREVAALGGGSLVALWLTAAVVRRRRPG